MNCQPGAPTLAHKSVIGRDGKPDHEREATWKVDSFEIEHDIIPMVYHINVSQVVYHSNGSQVYDTKIYQLFEACFQCNS